MASCNICGRKESKKRVVCERNICSECLRKLKENDYVLIDANKQDDEALLDRSTIADVNGLTTQDELNDDENDILRIKNIIKECLAEDNERNNNAMSILTNHIKYMQKDIDQKNILINELLEGLRNINKIKTPTNIMKENHINNETFAPFKTIRPSNSHRYTICLEDEEIQISNRFQPLQLPDEVSGDRETNKYMYHDDVNIITNNQTTKNTRSSGINATSSPKRRPQVVVKSNPEKENYFLKTVPGRASYTNITKEGKKTCLIGASILKRIDLKEFNRWLENGTAIKRCFGGAVASQLYHYIDEVLKEENVDRIIINIGTNNLTKKSQTENETVEEIMEIVKKCHNYGVNEIFISGLTCRPDYQTKVDTINKLLKLNAGKYNYIFIDNSDIQEKHLWWKDKLHLNKQGTINLACNFLDFLNNKVDYNIY